jgi:hypothetical protein
MHVQFYSVCLKGRGHLEDQSVVGWIILQKVVGKMCINYNCFMVESSDALL